MDEHGNGIPNENGNPTGIQWVCMEQDSTWEWEWEGVRMTHISAEKIPTDFLKTVVDLH